MVELSLSQQITEPNFNRLLFILYIWLQHRRTAAAAQHQPKKFSCASTGLEWEKKKYFFMFLAFFCARQANAVLFSLKFTKRFAQLIEGRDRHHIRLRIFFVFISIHFFYFFVKEEECSPLSKLSHM